MAISVTNGYVVPIGSSKLQDILYNTSKLLQHLKAGLLSLESLNLSDLSSTATDINIDNIKDQMKIVSEAEIIVSPHGAGLSYTVFCNKDATVIEIYGRSLLKKRHFLHIAHILGHKFLQFDDVIFHDGKKENMTVNIEKLNACIQTLIPSNI
jgi:hypothetical protein